MNPYSAPCGECDHHVFGCRNSCDAYAAWEKEHNAMVEKKRKALTQDALFFEMNRGRKRRSASVDHEKAMKKYRGK